MTDIKSTSKLLGNLLSGSTEMWTVNSSESAELSDSTTDRSALRRHSGRKNKCFHKKPTFGAS